MGRPFSISCVRSAEYPFTLPGNKPASGYGHQQPAFAEPLGFLNGVVKMVTRDLSDFITRVVGELADRVAIIDQGELRACGTLSELQRAYGREGGSLIRDSRGVSSAGRTLGGGQVRTCHSTWYPQSRGPSWGSGSQRGTGQAGRA